MNNKLMHGFPNPWKKRFNKPLFWIGIMMLAVTMGLMTNRWIQGENLLHAAVPSLQLETSDGFYEIGKSKGKVVIMFFSFPG